MKKYILIALLALGCGVDNECLSEEHYCPQNFHSTFYVEPSTTDQEIKEFKAWGNEWTEALEGRVTFDFSRDSSNPVPFLLVDSINEPGKTGVTKIGYTSHIKIEKTASNRRGLVIHELGHWIGLPHNDHYPSIMGMGGDGISQFDIDTFNRKYE